MRFLGAILTLSIKELRLLLRDRQAAALLFGMPAILILALSLALEDVYSEKIGTKLKVTLALEDDGAHARAFRDTLLQEGGFEIVERPAAVSTARLFRMRAAHADIRVPRGFSAAAAAFFAADAAPGLADHRIVWETSPSLDASYRWLLESRLAMVCAKIVRDELARSQEKLAAELERVGDKLSATALQLERAVAQMQRIAGGIEGDPSQLSKMFRAATAESAAAAEARALREQLGIASADPAPQPPPGSAVVGSESRPVVIEAPAGAGAGAGADAGTDTGAGARRVPAAAAGTAERVKAEIGRHRQEHRQVRDVAAAVRGGPELFLRRHAARDTVIVPTPLQQTVPGWALFAMFFIVVPLAQGLHRERIDGSMRRVLALGVPRSAIVLGKLLPFVFVGLLQFAVMLAVGLWVVPLAGDLSLELGAKPLVLVPITAACALAATSYAMLVATWSRTAEQAAAFGATSVVILSVLGGVMVPHFLMPDALQRAAKVSPLYWGHQAYLDAFLHGAGIAEVRDPLVFLGGFSLVCLLLSVRRVTS